MAFYQGKLKQGQNSTSCSGRGGYCTVERDKDANTLTVIGRRGKRYVIFPHSHNGGMGGTRMFPKVAVRIWWGSDDKVSVWIRSFAKRRKKLDKPTGYYKNHYNRRK